MPVTSLTRKKTTFLPKEVVLRCAAGSASFGHSYKMKTGDGIGSPKVLFMPQNRGAYP